MKQWLDHGAVQVEILVNKFWLRVQVEITIYGNGTHLLFQFLKSQSLSLNFDQQSITSIEFEIRQSYWIKSWLTSWKKELAVKVRNLAKEKVLSQARILGVGVKLNK